MKVLPIYGGQSILRQISALENGIHVVVGTPGRTIDLIKRRVLNLGSVEIVVLDEADRMLDMGFIDDIEYILSKVPSDRQTSLFSATIDQSVMNVCNRYMDNPNEILVSKDEIALSQINQYHITVNPRNKFRNLCKVLDKNQIEKTIIFCRTRIGTSKLADKLKMRRYNARPLHGGFTQRQRDTVMNLFRNGKLRMLVATDVAARGLDIEGVTHVINYDVPLEAKVYFHRIGRTARMGLKGTAITFVGQGDMSALANIRQMTKTEIIELKPFRDNCKLHDSVCSNCGKKCKVPFKPDPNRPVYCHSCYRNKK